MQQNQKYFALAAADGKLVPRFLVVSNLETTDSARDHRRQRAGVAGATRRCPVLLRPGSHADPARACAGARASRRITSKLGTQLDRVARTARIASAFAEHDRRGYARTSRAPRDSPKADLDHRDGRRVSRAAGPHGPRTTPTRRRASTAVAAAIERALSGRASPATRFRRRRWRSSGRARRQARDALGIPFGIGAQTNRRQGSVRPSPPRDRRHPHLLVERGLARDASHDLVGRGRVQRSRGAWPGRRRTRARERSRMCASPLSVLTLQALCEARSCSPTQLRPTWQRSQSPANQCRSRCRGYDLAGLPRLAAVQLRALPERPLAAANKRIVNILRKSGSEAATAVDRGRLVDGAEHDLYLVFQKLEPVVVDRCAYGRFRRRARGAGGRQACRSTASSTTCSSWRTIRRSARTGWRCCEAWRRR